MIADSLGYAAGAIGDNAMFKTLACASLLMAGLPAAATAQPRPQSESPPRTDGCETDRTSPACRTRRDGMPRTGPATANELGGGDPGWEVQSDGEAEDKTLELGGGDPGWEVHRDATIEQMPQAPQNPRRPQRSNGPDRP